MIFKIYFISLNNSKLEERSEGQNSFPMNCNEEKNVWFQNSRFHREGELTTINHCIEIN